MLTGATDLLHRAGGGQTCCNTVGGRAAIRRSPTRVLPSTRAHEPALKLRSSEHSCTASDPKMEKSVISGRTITDIVVGQVAEPPIDTGSPSAGRRYRGEPGGLGSAPLRLVHRR